MWDITDPDDPVFLRDFTTPAVTSWHSAAFSWDGSVTVMGWEPGGGEEPECEASDPAEDKSIFFFDTATGALLGMWTLPRPQSAVENCTIHNYSVVPTAKRDVLTTGNYQAGTWVVDFTDPTRPRTVAWSDPPPLDPANFTPGGAWGSYWYRGLIFETNITEGLNIFRLSDRTTAEAVRMPFLNPQTQVGPGHRPRQLLPGPGSGRGRLDRGVVGCRNRSHRGQAWSRALARSTPSSRASTIAWKCGQDW